MPVNQAYSPVARVLIVVAAFVVVIAGVKSAQALIVPLILAAFIAIVLLSPMSWLKARGLPQWAALLVVMLLALLVILMVAGLVGNSIDQFSAALPEYQERLNQDMGSVFALLQRWGIDLSDSSLKDILAPGRVMQLVADLLGNFGGVVANGFLILLTVVFILSEASSFANKLRHMMRNPDSALHRVALFTDSAKQYMVIKACVSLVTGILVATFLSILGVDFAILWGLLAFFLNFIPNIGSVLAAVPPVLLAFVQLGAGTSLIVALGYLAVNVVIGNIVEPRFMGKGVGLSTLVVFLSLVFWGWVLGPVGMLLSVPLTMLVKIALDNREDTAWLAVLLGADSELEDASAVD